MARHPARRAHVLALIGAGLLIVTFGTMGIELGNEMARHGDLDRQSTAAGSYLRNLHHATSEARICYYSWLARKQEQDAACYTRALSQLAAARSGYDGFKAVQLREGAGRAEPLTAVAHELDEVAGWKPEAAAMPAGGEQALTALDNNLSVLSHVSTMDQADRVANMLRNTSWQRRLGLLGILTGVLSLISAGWVLDRSSLAAARAEASSRDLALRLRATLDSLSLGVAVFGADGRLWHWNEQLGTVLGLERDFLKFGLPYDTLSAALVVGGVPLLEPFEHIEASLSLGQSVPPVMVECKGINGADLELCRTLFFAPDGAAARRGFVLTAADISMRLRSERALGEAQKLRALGQLTAGIAHDFKNLLTVILGNLELAADHDQPDHVEQRQEYLSAATHAGRRSEALTGQLLSFMRRQSSTPDSLSLSDLFSFLGGLLGRIIGPRIVVECGNGSDIWPVRADPAQLESAVLNLAINARDAMPTGGRLRIVARNVTFSVNADLMSLPVEDGRNRRVVSDPTPLPAGDWVRLDVIDSGCGMTDEVLHHLFEPFFTTKEEGAGTGLGMAMVLAFSQQVKGRVVVATGERRGTEVSLWLPRAVAVDEVTGVQQTLLPRATPPAVKPQVRPIQVLVVEDDAAIRDIVVTILGMAGHRVLEAADGEQAFDVAASAEGKLDLLVTDLQLPGPLDGLTLSRVLAGRYEDLAVVYMSGDLTPDSPSPAGAVEGAHLLAKPFRRDGLMRAVTSALSARAGV
ncbi:ATP-binding protein [Acetobacter tropicalis]|uniref:histidine kinase n=3 Tax=Acetobacter TaxID=434 RepID=A0A0U5ET49_9PROT|nr:MULTISPECIES: ATP-binding protein [Acetobacter]ATJ90097.1 hybrid sensor histidine kinase/response regulator [Acetobacter tropicalis]KXV56502.1 histidine kinase [Acetobacter senegalensis]MCC6105639.1 response regulator [Acetobacter sp.]MCG4253932.1 response regulator [Acetobacter senegalensis]MCG4257987.1 response regulator [Acetobacter senegalensis]